MEMIAGIGTDIVEVKRMQEKIDRHPGFIQQVFSANEQSYCKAQKNQAQHFAARFAAKEAFLKASGKGLLLSYELCDIEVVHNDNGQPYFQFYGAFANLIGENSWNMIHLSLSHIDEFAVAFVTIEK